MENEPKREFRTDVSLNATNVIDGFARSDALLADDVRRDFIEQYAKRDAARPSPALERLTEHLRRPITAADLSGPDYKPEPSGLRKRIGPTPGPPTFIEMLHSPKPRTLRAKCGLPDEPTPTFLGLLDERRKARQ